MTEKLNTVGLAHHFIKQYVKDGDFCIDATAGRGHDTVFLCRLVGEQGCVTAFDIQQDALNSTDSLLRESGLRDRARLILDSHENMEQYVRQETISCITFNFGYLPGGDHSVCTHAETSIPAIQAGLRLLKDGGIMSLCIYYGGDTGFEEKNELLQYLKTIDSRRFTVVTAEFSNRPNNPPIPVFIWKRI